MSSEGAMTAPCGPGTWSKQAWPDGGCTALRAASSQCHCSTDERASEQVQLSWRVEESSTPLYQSINKLIVNLRQRAENELFGHERQILRSSHLRVLPYDFFVARTMVF